MYQEDPTLGQHLDQPEQIVIHYSLTRGASHCIGSCLHCLYWGLCMMGTILGTWDSPERRTQRGVL